MHSLKLFLDLCCYTDSLIHIYYITVRSAYTIFINLFIEIRYMDGQLVITKLKYTFANCKLTKCEGFN